MLGATQGESPITESRLAYAVACSGWHRRIRRIEHDATAGVVDVVVLNYFMPPLLSLRSGGPLTVQPHLVAILVGKDLRWQVAFVDERIPDMTIIGSEDTAKMEAEDMLRTFDYQLPVGARDVTSDPPA